MATPINRYERVSSVGGDLNPGQSSASRVLDNDESSLSRQQYEQDQNQSPSLPSFEDASNRIGQLRHQHRFSVLLTEVLFVIAGLLNNGPYVIMLACAKSIAEGGVAAVYIANIVPSLAVKLTAPYWFDRVPYNVRLRYAAICMGVAFTITAYFTHQAQKISFDNDNDESHMKPFREQSVLTGELLGVALISLQCGLGEASLLALAGKWDSNEVCDVDAAQREHKTKGRFLTCFSAGTGLAGPLGYLWKIALTEWLGWNVTAALCAAAVLLSISYALICHKLSRALVDEGCNMILTEGDGIFIDESTSSDENEEGQELVSYSDQSTQTTTIHSLFHEDAKDTAEVVFTLDDELSANEDTNFDSHVPPIEDLSIAERFQLIQTMCWPYMVPLFLVYAAEYACQAGAWTSIGFPVTSKAARSAFYEQSNWLYQLGVFLSRSSGTLFSVNMLVLWFMPMLQVVNLVLFSMTAATGTEPTQGLLYHQPVLLLASFITGLLGGAVYIHGYKRIVADVPTAYTEFCLASTSVAEGFGILVADVAGLFLQSCLYRKNGITGALVRCPGG